MTGLKRRVYIFFPEISMFPEMEPRETSKFKGNEISLESVKIGFLRDKS